MAAAQLRSPQFIHATNCPLPGHPDTASTRLRGWRRCLGKLDMILREEYHTGQAAGEDYSLEQVASYNLSLKDLTLPKLRT